MEQEKKVEDLSFQISHYINARKQFVEKYNTLLKYPKTKANKNAINESLLQLYEVITDYDEKIEDLAKDKINAEVDLNDYIADLGS
jgi:flagellar hook-associated protein FlgK